MTRILIVFLFVLAGFALGPILQNQQGYVYFEFGQYEVTTSMTVFILLLVLLFCALYFCIRLVRKLFRFATTSGDWFARTALNRSGRKADLAQMKVLEGDYQTAEKLLARSAKSSRRPALQYLQAAEAAQFNGDNIRANQLLEQAAAVCTDSDKFAFDIVRLRLQIENKEVQAAKQSADQLLNQKPRHPEVLRLAEKAYLLSGDYQTLIDLLPIFNKVKTHDENQLNALTQTVYLRLIRKLAQGQNRDALLDWWRLQPRRIVAMPEYQYEVASQLLAMNQQADAGSVILTGLKKHFDADLVRLLGEFPVENPATAEKTLRKLLKSKDLLSSADVALIYRTIAKIAMSANQWQQAEQAMSKAIELNVHEEDSNILAEIQGHQ